MKLSDMCAKCAAAGVRSLAGILLLFMTAVAGCTDGATPSDLGSAEGPITLALAPRFHLLGNSSQLAPITVARLTVLDAVTRNIIDGPFSIPVNPDDAEWDLPVTFNLPAGRASESIVVLVELLSVTSGTPAIEWSGVSSPIAVTAGDTPAQPSTVDVYQGPPGNLSVTSISITNPPSTALTEGDSTKLIAVAQGNSSAQIFWETSNPAVATVNATGMVKVLRDGSVFIRAAAGAFRDSVLIQSRARATAMRILPDTLRAISTGEELLFNAEVRDTRGALVTGEALTWTSSNEAVVHSLGNGRFQAVANGVATVRAQAAGNATLFATATAVVSRRVATVTLDLGSLDFTSIGDQHQFVATARDGAGVVMDGAVIRWSTNNAAAVSVNTTGLATAVASGSATITAATDDGPSATALINVHQVVALVTAAPDSVILTSAGAQETFTARAVDARAAPVADVVFEWTSLDPSVATVDANGRVSAVANGRARIRVGADTRADTVFAIVTYQPGSVVVSPDARVAESIGEVLEFSAVVRDGQGNVIAAETVTWTSSDPNVLRTLGGGRFEAVANGTATIRAISVSSPAISGTASASVSQRVASVRLDLGVLALTAIGDQRALVATVLDARGVPVAGAPVQWSSSNAAVATVDGAGMVTAVSTGSAVITATSTGGAAATTQVTVSQVLERITITPSSITLTAVGDSTRVTAALTDRNGNPVAGSVTWTSSDPAVAVVDEAGVVHSTGTGSATITATSGTVQGSVGVTVEQQMVRLQVSPDTATLTQAGAQKTFTARAFDRNNNGFNVTVLWASSSPSVATINAAGVATAVATGQTTITASVGSFSANAQLKVAPAGINLQLTSATVTPAGPVAIGSDVAFNIAGANSGSLPAPAAVTRITIRDAVTDAVVLDSLLPQPPVPAGTPIAASIPFHIRSNIAWPDSVRVTVLVDALNTISELVETDNSATTVAVRIVPGADAVVLSQDTIIFDDGGTADLDVEDQNGNPIEATFRSTNEYAATVDEDGIVTPVSNGYTRVIAEFNGNADTTFVRTGPGVPEIEGFDKMWVGFADHTATSWNDPSNWLPRGVPTLTDDVFVPDCSVFNEFIGPNGGCTPDLMSNVQVHDLTTGYYFYLDEYEYELDVFDSFGGDLKTFAGRSAVRGPTTRDSAFIAMKAAIDSARAVRSGVRQSRAPQTANLRSSFKRDALGRPVPARRKGAAPVSAFTTAPLRSIAAEYPGDHVRVNNYTLAISGDIPDWINFGPYQGNGHVVLNGTEQKIAGFFSQVDVTVDGTYLNLERRLFECECGYPTGLQINGNLTISGSMHIDGDQSISVNSSGYDPGSLVVSGSLSVDDNVQISVNGDFLIDGDVELDGADVYVYNNLTVQNGGKLDLGACSIMLIANTMSTATGGTLVMQGYDSGVLVGHAVFDGGNTSGVLTQGELYVYGNFNVGNSGGHHQAFAPSDNHRTEFGTVEGTHTVSIVEPGSGGEGNHFNHFATYDQQLVSTGPLFVDGDAYVCAPVSAPSATVRGDLEVCDGPMWQVETTTLTGHENNSIYVSCYSDGYYYCENWMTTELIIHGSRYVSNLNLAGNITIDGEGSVLATGGASLQVNGGVLISNGGRLVTDIYSNVSIYENLTSHSGGVLEMTNNSWLSVNGDVALNGGTNLFTSGHLQVNGSFQASAVESDPAHITEFYANGVEPHMLSLGAGAELGRLFITNANEIQLGSNVTLAGPLIDFNSGTTPYNVISAASTLTLQVLGGIQAQSVNFHNVTLDVTVSLEDDVSDHLIFLEFTGFSGSSADQLRIHGSDFTGNAETDFVVNTVAFDQSGSGAFIHLFGTNFIVDLWGSVPSIRPGDPDRTKANGAPDTNSGTNQGSHVIWPSDTGGTD